MLLRKQRPTSLLRFTNPTFLLLSQHSPWQFTYNRSLIRQDQL
jgi:hypothetical protein